MASTPTAGTTLREVFISWITSVNHEIWGRSRRLVDGPLLKRRGGRLYDSIYQKVSGAGSADLITGEVGTSSPHGVIWELTGVKGPIRPKGTKTNLKLGINPKRMNKGAFSTIIFRKASYTKTSYKPPVRFLQQASTQIMGGNNGSRRLMVLGENTGRAILYRFERMWKNMNSDKINITVR